MDRAVRTADKTRIFPDDYLQRKASEVISMFFNEYDYDTDIRVQRAEAKEEGARETAIENAKNLLKMNILTTEQISQAVSLPLEIVISLKEELDFTI